MKTHKSNTPTQGHFDKQVKTARRTRPKQTAAYFQISVMTLWRWRQNSTFPQPLKRGQVVLYDIASIEQWLAQEAAE